MSSLPAILLRVLLSVVLIFNGSGYAYAATQMHMASTPVASALRATRPSGEPLNRTSLGGDRPARTVPRFYGPLLPHSSGAGDVASRHRQARPGGESLIAH